MRRILPDGPDLEPGEGELGQVAEDRIAEVLRWKRSPPAVDQRIGRRTTAVVRRVLLVEVLVAPAQVLGEPAAGRVVVQEPELSRAVVVEAVHEAGRHHDEGARARGDAVELRADLEGELALEDVERIDVMEVDVRFGATLADRVTRPGDREPLVVAEDPQLPRRRVRDRLALAGPMDDRLPHRPRS